jgi:thioredoxin reductase (NADPH)
MSERDKRGEAPLVRILGRRGSAPCHAVRDFLYRSDVPFEWVELHSDEEARTLAGMAHLHDPRLPVCLFADGTRMECPSIRQITEKLGWFRSPSRTEYDLAIYGAGPAGLSAAVYGASDGLKTVIVERYALGGQAGSTSKIENYLGFPAGISGSELAERARQQAEKFGVEILLAREGVRAECAPGQIAGHLADGTKLVARTTICTTGVTYRRLGLPNEERFLGAGLFYGAGASEAPFTRGEHVYVVGGGNSAGQATMHFAPYATRVTMIVRDESLSSTVSQYLIDRIYATPNVEVLTRTEVIGLDGDDCLREITMVDRRTGEERKARSRWLFVCIGGVPQTEWAVEVGMQRDAGGYLVTGPDLLRDSQRPPGWPLERDPYYLETNIPGLFAAGDVRHGSVKRCASAVGEGAMAVALVHRYLADAEGSVSR